MNSSELIEHINQLGLGRPLAVRPGIVKSVAVGPIELAVARKPSDAFMRARWRERVGSSVTAYLLIADNPQRPGQVLVLGPIQSARPIQAVRAELLADSLKRMASLSPLEAVRRLADDIARIGGDGLTVNGLLTRHTLEFRFMRDESRWATATAMLHGVGPGESWRGLFTKLGYILQRLPLRGHLARHNERPIVVVHPKPHARDLARVDKQGRPPEGLLLEDCETLGAPFGILTHDGRYRLFDAKSASPASEWLELDARLLGQDRLPLLALLAPPFLAEGGFAALRTEARDFGVGLHNRLDRTIREDALPALAVGMQNWAKSSGVGLGNDGEREEFERAALTLVFRIVFILFCESTGYLPMINRAYERRSLSSLVREAYKTQSKLSPISSALWSGFVLLVQAMRDGNPAWDVPAYNGPLFAPRDFDGAELLERMELRDPEFAKVLIAIGQDQETKRGADFSTLEISHIGHTYESLLSLQLSIAKQAVRYDRRHDRYVEVKDLEHAEVTPGGLLWQTYQGGRKAGGVYYTPVDLVRHLVERAVLPAYEQHLKKVVQVAKKDPGEAAQHLLSFAVVDPACGSAHFLVQVAETLAERTVRFLAEHPLPAIIKALERLRSVASIRVEIDDLPLLRRLLVKHCVFGVDISPMGAEVATMSLWLAAFVPGLSLSYLGRNVVVGDSLIGVANPHTVIQKGGLFNALLRRHLDEATEIVRSLAQISDRTPEEVEASRKADQKAKQVTAGLKRLFDLWTAEQFGLSGARAHVESHGGEVIEGNGGDPRELIMQAKELSRMHRFLHWPLAFSQVFSREHPGFDVVVGNPPWEELTVEELSFFGFYHPGIHSLRDHERSKVVSDLIQERPDLSQLYSAAQDRAKRVREALKAGDYDPMDGDTDLYKYFCQRYRSLVRSSGFIGVVLPRTAFNAKGSEGFRKWLYARSETRRIDFLLNRRRWMFETHPQYSVALVVAKNTSPGPTHRIAIAGTATSPTEWREQSSTRGVLLTPSAFGPGKETPLLRNQDEADLLARLRLGNRFPHGAGGRWSCFPVAEFHETKDRDFWKGKTEGRPLWKGESFDQYEPTGAGQRWCAETEELLKKVRKPRPGSKSLLASAITLKMRRQAVLTELERARVAFRDVTRSTDSRTIRACLVPPGVLLTNTAPYLAFVSGTPVEQAACLGIMNSLFFDWQARRFIDKHANYFLLEGFHLPNLNDDGFHDISRAAARLSAVDGRFADFAMATDVEFGPLGPATHNELRVEIDVRVARAWNLTTADLAVIFRDYTDKAVTPAYRAALIDRLE